MIEGFAAMEMIGDAEKKEKRKKGKKLWCSGYQGFAYAAWDWNHVSDVSSPIKKKM